MIYDQHGLKFRYYLRRLTPVERLYSEYHEVTGVEVEKLQEVEENNIAREQRRWYSNWDNLPQLGEFIIDLHVHGKIDNRKVIEYRKLLKRHSDKAFWGPWPRPSP